MILAGTDKPISGCPISREPATSLKVRGRSENHRKARFSDPLAGITVLRRVAFVMEGGVTYKSGGIAVADPR